MNTSNTKIQLHIGGMTCVNCQNKIEKGLNRTEGIVSASVSYNKGTADIVYDKEKLSLKEIKAVIENLDYEVLPEKASSKAELSEAASPEEWVQESDSQRVICMLLIIICLYVMLQSLGILNLLVPGQLADAKMGYGMLFMIGLITSVHCIAMCGGINLSQCIPRTGQKETDGSSKLAAFRPAFLYNLGRVFSYTAVGFVLGLTGYLIGGGTEFGLSTLLQGILKMIAGLFMVIMGINMLGLFPGLRKFTIRTPKFIAGKVGKKQTGSNSPFFVGILNGFMPCGPLQSMWIVALAAADPFAGALSMFLFSLGTVPLMLGLGSIVSALGKKFSEKVFTVGAVLVTVLGLAMLSQGGSLSGWLPPDLLLVLLVAFSVTAALLNIPVRKKLWKIVLRAAALLIVIGSYSMWSAQGMWVQDPLEAVAEIEIVDGVQIVNSTLSSGSYPNITVQAGVPVRWTIEAPEGSINGCNNRIVIQDYDIEYTFHTGENVIEFTPTEAGTVSYSCWMGMIRGSIYVMDEAS